MPLDPFLKLSAPAGGGYWEVPVLFEDEHLLALDKPSGLLSSPDRYDPERPNLMRLLHTHIARGVPWARERGLSYLANAHRLDLDTSGIILLAKSKVVLTALTNQFGAEKPLKQYFALVHGVPREEEFTIEGKLAPHPTRVGVMQMHPKEGKQSRTDFRVAEKFIGYAVLDCLPRTGRTHQIRAHLRWANYPIVGDRVYGGSPLMLSELKTDYRTGKGREERPLIARVALHASVLELAHPVSGAPLRIEAPLPKDLRVALKYLRKYAVPGGVAAPESDAALDVPPAPVAPVEVDPEPSAPPSRKPPVKAASKPGTKTRAGEGDTWVY
ncbi:MAG: hypothetical protein IT581_20895 [Verrucomicrobiales bacterium]|nr:hypothetical protein [Verrucomicrobiales bacterium]